MKQPYWWQFSSMTTKAGFTAVIGRPNVGKSTIVNKLIGQKISIVSDKPQTTRHRILGILTGKDHQVVFVDTPGVHRPGYRLNERMMDTVYEALKDVDLLVQVIDVSESYGKGEEYVLDLIRMAEKPTMLVINKVDLVNKGKVLPVIEFYSQQVDFREIIPLSTRTGANLELLHQKIVEHLPGGEFFYPPESITDQTERSIVAEIIREKVLDHTHKELPYSTAVLVEQCDEGDRDQGFVRIAASIVTEKESQKKIVIGRGGRMVKTIGTAARRDIQDFLAVRKVYLDLNVKVVPGWRNREHFLDQLGVRLDQYTVL